MTKTTPDYEDTARSIVIFLTMVGPHYGSKMYRHLDAGGNEVPEWLKDIIPDKDHTPPMACFAIAIAKLYEPYTEVYHPEFLNGEPKDE